MLLLRQGEDVMRTVQSFSVAIAVGAFAVACEPTVSATPVSSTTTTSASPGLVSPERAIERVTEARCQRQLSCGYVGGGQFFQDYDACSHDLRQATRQFLIAASCSEGMDEWALSTCTNDIRNNACDDPHGAVEYLPSCSSVRLCR